MDKQTATEIIVLLIGSAIIIFSSWLGPKANEVQRKSYGFKFDKNEDRNATISTATIGLVFVIAAVVSMLEITSFRL